MSKINQMKAVKLQDVIKEIPKGIHRIEGKFNVGVDAEIKININSIEASCFDLTKKQEKVFNKFIEQRMNVIDRLGLFLRLHAMKADSTLQEDSDIEVIIYAKWVDVDAIDQKYALSKTVSALYVSEVKVNGSWLDTRKLGLSSIEASIFDLNKFPVLSLSIDTEDPQPIFDYIEKIEDEIRNECPFGKVFKVEGECVGFSWIVTLDSKTKIKTTI